MGQPEKKVAAPRLAMDPAGQMIRQTWQWFNEHLRMLLSISFLAAVPQIIGAIFSIAFIGATVKSSGSASVTQFAAASFGLVIWGIISAVWSVFGTLALYLYIAQPDPNRKVLEWYRLGAQYFWNYIGTSIVLGLIVIAGLVVFLIPGIYFAGIYFLAPLMAVLEKKGISQSLKRSKELVKGHWGSALWRNFLMALIVGAASLVLWTIVSAATHSFAASASSSAWASFGSTIQQIVTIILSPLPLIMTYLIYQNLKKIKG